jgi:hypothetical protein
LANVTPTKKKAGKNFDVPSATTFALLQPAYKKLVKSVAKLLDTFITVCPHSGDCIASVLEEMSDESLDMRDLAGGGGARVFWQEGEEGEEGEGRLRVLVSPNIHISRAMDKRVPLDTAIEYAKSAVDHLGLVAGAGGGGLKMDGKAYMATVRGVSRSENKQAFDGETRARASRKLKAGRELNDKEKQERKKQIIDAKNSSRYMRTGVTAGGRSKADVTTDKSVGGTPLLSISLSLSLSLSLRKSRLLLHHTKTAPFSPAN